MSNIDDYIKNNASLHMKASIADTLIDCKDMNIAKAKKYRSAIEVASESFDDQTLLEYPLLCKSWKSGVDYIVDDRVSIEEGGTVLLYKCIQAHTSQDSWKPSIDTASLWTRIDVEHSGTADDPIPYNTNMEIFKDKYYIQNDVLYLCIRDSQQPLYNDLSDLIDIYVQVV